MAITPIALVVLILETLKAIFTFLATDQGQLTVKDWREGRIKFEEGLSLIDAKLKGLGADTTAMVASVFKPAFWEGLAKPK